MKKLKNGLTAFLVSILFLSLAGCGTPTSSPDTVSTSSKMATDNVVTLYVTRHGKTMLNTSERVQGWADSPLTEAGVDVAEDLGRGLKDVQFAAAYSSDSGRARETADLVLKHNATRPEVHESSGLREWNFGIFEGDKSENMMKAASGGASAAEFLKFPIEKVADSIAAADSTKQAEDWKTLSHRIKTEFDKISSEAANNGGGNVLVVSHGLTISSIIEMLDSSKTKVGLENASVTKITYTRGSYDVETVGDTSYAAKGKEAR